MSTVVSEGIILIAVVISAAMLSTTFMSGIADLQSSTLVSTKEISETIKTSVNVIHAVKFTSTKTKVWVKNVGSTVIYTNSIENSDIYFGEDGDFSYYDYVPSGEGWAYTLLESGATKWYPQDTIEITVTSASSLVNGDYYVSFTTHNGVKDELYFSIG